jgi:hypothetical protein
MTHLIQLDLSLDQCKHAKGTVNTFSLYLSQFDYKLDEYSLSINKKKKKKDVCDYIIHIHYEKCI